MMIRKLMGVGLMFLCATAPAQQAPAPAKPKTAPSGMRYLQQVNQKYMINMQRLIQTSGISEYARPIYDPATKTATFTISYMGKEMNLVAKALPVAFTEDGTWQWIQSKDGLDTTATSKTKKWLSANGWDGVTKQPIFTITPNETRAFLAIAAEQTGASYYFPAKFGSRIVSIVLGEPEQAAAATKKTEPKADKEASSVSVGQIRKWLGINEPMEIGELFKVRMFESGEIAFIANVSFPEQRGGVASGVALVRPRLSMARIIEMDPISQVIDLGDLTSGVISSSYESGQGLSISSNTYSVIYGWGATSLMKTEWRDNTGDCGADSYNKLCESEDVKWTIDKTADGSVLVETISKGAGPDPDHLELVKTIKKYALRDGAMVDL